MQVEKKDSIASRNKYKIVGAILHGRPVVLNIFSGSPQGMTPTNVYMHEKGPVRGEKKKLQKAGLAASKKTFSHVTGPEKP